jgi:hypothetical protein
VWLVDDGSVSGTSAFVALLGREHYVQTRVWQFAGATLSIYRRTS